MKNLFLFLAVFASVLVTSCSSDDDGTGQDPIIAKWNFFSSADVIDGVVGTREEGTACKKRGFVDFKADGTYVFISYFENQSGDCVIDDETNGTWENLGNNIYRFQFDATTNESPVSIEGNMLTITSREDSSVYIK